MKIRTFAGLFICVLGMNLWTGLSVFAQQTITARPNTPLSPNCNGFYESLPEDYATSGKKYPVLLFLHGMGELGDGNSQLSWVLRNGPPMLLSKKQFPSSFTVNGKTFSFIVICPQFKLWPQPTATADVERILNYIFTNYRVDRDRVYLSGLSMGGVFSWDFAGNNKNAFNLTAMSTVSGARWPAPEISKQIADANMYEWTINNDGDGTSSLAYCTEQIRLINAYAPGKGLGKLTVFNSTSHDAWTKGYDPNFREDGMNMYEWFLSKTRNIDIILPVLLKSFNASVKNSNVLLNWTTAQEELNSSFLLEKSTDGIHFTEITRIAAREGVGEHSYSFTDSNPAEGTNYYRLSQTDINGNSKVLETIAATIKRDYPLTLNVFPNPALNTLSINFNEVQSGRLHLAMLTADGKTIFHGVYNKSSRVWSENIPVTMLKPGYYWVRISIGSAVYTSRFIKQ